MQRFTGYEPSFMDELKLSFANSHLGPRDGQELQGQISTGGSIEGLRRRVRNAHQDHLVCCRANFWTKGKGASDTGDCIYAVNKASVLDQQAREKHKFYVFDDIPSYIQSFVSPLFLGQFKCISFYTAGDFEEARDAVKEFANQPKYYPSTVVTNIGIHIFFREEAMNTKSFKMFQQFTDNARAPIKYIMHSTTPVKPPARGSNDEIAKYNELMKSLMSTWKKNVAYLNFWEYALALQAERPLPAKCVANKVPSCQCKRDDGVHFLRWCNYVPLITQWDFNWMLSLNAFQIKPPRMNNRGRRLSSSFESESVSAIELKGSTVPMNTSGFDSSVTQ